MRGRIHHLVDKDGFSGPDCYSLKIGAWGGLVSEDAAIDEALVTHLYDGALHDGNWRPAIERLRNLLECTEMSLSFLAPAGPLDTRHETYVTGNFLTAETIARYNGYYFSLDPKRPMFDNRKVGFLFNDIDHFDDDFVNRNPFYQEFSRPVDSRHTLDMLLSRTPSQEVYLASMRSPRQGHYDSKAVAIFRQASRHFANVAKLRKTIITAERSANHAKMGLDALAFGIIVLDGSALVVTANSVAVKACASAQGLSLVKGRLSAHSASVDQSLNRAIHEILANGASAGITLRVPRPDDQAWLISIVPLPASSPLAVQNAPSALVLIGDGSLGRGIRREDLIAIYGLTMAEAELAMLLGHGDSLSEAADHRGVKISTARSQMHSILQKMQIQRQADLTRILAAMPTASVAR